MKKTIYATKKELFYDNFSAKWAGEINDLETNKRLRVVFGNFLKSNNIKFKKFLEVGCGMGYFSNKATQLGARVTGVDVGANLIKMCRATNKKAKFLVASASDLPFKDNTYDVLLSTEVIEHVEMQSLALKEMVRVLKPRGIMVITTPNRIFKTAFDLLSLIGIRPYKGNEKWYFPWVLKKELELNGLKVVKEYYFNFVYPNKYLDKLENKFILKFLCINYGIMLQKV